MKKIIFISLLSVTLFSCGSVTRTVSGSTESKLLKTVSIEQNCPVGELKVVERVKGVGQATYAIEGCGKRFVYKQMGSIFMESSKEDSILQK